MKNQKNNKKNNTENKPTKIKDSENYFPKSHRVKLIPNIKQIKKINDYIAASRKVWNVTNHDIHCNGIQSDNELRNKYVIKKNMPDENINKLEWTFRTPKRIREYAIKDLISSYKSCETKKKKGQITRFTIKNKNRKSKQQNIVIPHEGSKIKDNKIHFTGGLVVKLQEKIKDQDIKHNMRLIKDGPLYFIHIPYFTNISYCKITSERKNKTVGIDPGENIYHSYYTPSGEYGIIGSDIKERLTHLYNKEKNIEKNVTKSKLRKAIKKITKRRLGLIDDFHWKLCHWYLEKYEKIIIPRLYIKKKYSKESRELQNNLKHCTFVNRLIYKSCLYENTEIHECREHYTSQSCTNCGSLNTIKDKTVFCNKCKFEIHRDLAGARNMVMKHILLNS